MLFCLPLSGFGVGGGNVGQMHLAEPMAPEAQDGKFGFVVNNTIGGTPQPNEWMDNYVDFFREKRLGHQLRLARDSTLSSLGKKLMEKLPTYFEGQKLLDRGHSSFSLVL